MAGASDPDPEVPEIGVALGVEQDVGRPDVPVCDPLPVRERERGGDLLDDAKRALPVQRLASFLERSKAAAPQVPGDDVRPARLPPVVVDRDDVRMLERRDGLGLRLEPTDERPSLDEPLVEDLDGHVAFDLGLDPAEDDARRPVVDLLQQPIAAERFAPEIEPGSCLRIRSWSLASSGEGSIPSSSARISLRPLEGSQRIGLTPLAIERQHQQAPEAVPRRGGGRAASPPLPPLAPVCAARQQPLDPFLLRLEPKVVEPRRLGAARDAPPHVGECRPSPERQRVVERAIPPRRIDGERLLRVSHEIVEPGRVQLGGIEPQA